MYQYGHDLFHKSEEMEFSSLGSGNLLSTCDIGEYDPRGLSYPYYKMILLKNLPPLCAYLATGHLDL